MERRVETMSRKQWPKGLGTFNLEKGTLRESVQAAFLYVVL